MFQARPSITIPNDVTSIGDNAFDGCSKLTDITIPDGVTNIGVAAFRNCSSATSITIPDSITYIGAYVFSGCSNLTNITISDSVTIIGNYAFSGCSGLTSITIPDSVTNIDTYAFSKCSNLKTINLGSGITEIDSYAFDGCTNLTDIYYNNTFAKFQEIYIDNIGNKPFIQATKHYVSDPPPIVPDDPTEKGTVIAVKPVKGTAGNEITVPIYIKNNPGISGFSFKIDYDITQLVPLSITKNPDLPGSLTSNIEQPGNYTGLAYVTAVWSNASDYSENGELFYITFKVYGTIKKGSIYSNKN